MSTSTPDVSASRASRLPLIVGLTLAALGLVAYVAQVAARQLWTPLYLPLTGILGTLLVAAALWQRRTVLRGLAFVSVFVLTVIESGFLLVTQLPPYQGPVVVGQPFPAFKGVRREDGSRFTSADLAGGSNTVFVFFRGRW
jgi:hypothetical protein